MLDPANSMLAYVVHIFAKLQWPFCKTFNVHKNYSCAACSSDTEHLLGMQLQAQRSYNQKGLVGNS